MKKEELKEILDEFFKRTNVVCLDSNCKNNWNCSCAFKKIEIVKGKCMQSQEK